MSVGWIKLHRKICDSWVFKDANHLKAWLVILTEANVEAETVTINGIPRQCNRGEKFYSLTTWASKFGHPWNKMKVYRFFRRLENETMIVTKTERDALRLTVLNYDIYQGSGNDERDGFETPTVTDIRSINNNIYNTCSSENDNANDLFALEAIEQPKSVFSFDEFWNMYGKKKNRDRCEKLYENIDEPERAAIKERLPFYIANTADIQFRMYPEKYLNGKRWNDEIKSKAPAQRNYMGI